MPPSNSDNKKSGFPAFSVIPRVNNCWFLTGPTASGKTKLGVDLAKRMDAEIISLDSMAVYRGMDIGTAKPTLEEREGVPHWLIDIVEPSQDFSLAMYMTAARAKVEEIQARGNKVLFVGGTPLYLKGLLRGIFDGPEADPELRSFLEGRENTFPGSLHQELAEVDPETALRLHPNDRRRIIRALEVFEKTGYPISFFQKQFDVPASFEQAKVFVLDWPRDILYSRIDRRVDLMMAAGFEEEVRHLLSAEQPPGRTASQAVGYRELIAAIHGETTMEEAIEKTKQFSRNFAKSQGTWFRSLTECHEVPVSLEITESEIISFLTEQGFFSDNEQAQNR